MATVKVSTLNKTRLDKLLACKIGETQNPALTMDDIIGELIDLWEQEEARRKNEGQV